MGDVDMNTSDTTEYRYIYQVLSFLGTLPNVHENMMLPKSDVFMLIRNSDLRGQADRAHEISNLQEIGSVIALAQHAPTL